MYRPGGGEWLNTIVCILYELSSRPTWNAAQNVNEFKKEDPGAALVLQSPEDRPSE